MNDAGPDCNRAERLAALARLAEGLGHAIHGLGLVEAHRGDDLPSLDLMLGELHNLLSSTADRLLAAERAAVAAGREGMQGR